MPPPWLVPPLPPAPPLPPCPPAPEAIPPLPPVPPPSANTLSLVTAAAASDRGVPPRRRGGFDAYVPGSPVAAAGGVAADAAVAAVAAVAVGRGDPGPAVATVAGDGRVADERGLRQGDRPGRRVEA